MLSVRHVIVRYFVHGFLIQKQIVIDLSFFNLLGNLIENWLGESVSNAVDSADLIQEVEQTKLYLFRVLLHFGDFVD